MKVGRIKDPLYKDSYFGITPPTFIPPFEAPETDDATAHRPGPAVGFSSDVGALMIRTGFLKRVLQRVLKGIL